MLVAADGANVRSQTLPSTRIFFVVMRTSKADPGFDSLRKLEFLIGIPRTVTCYCQ